MKSLLYYLVQLIICSGILYSYYHFVLRNKKFHLYNRYYLLAAVVLSVGVPFLNIPVYFSDAAEKPSLLFQTLLTISPYRSEISLSSVPAAHTSVFTIENVLKAVYFFVSAIILVRLLAAFFKLKILLDKYVVERIDHIHFINTHEPGTPFSFFKWLFWNNKIELNSEEGQQIFRHELFHIEQKHSWDIIFMEIISVIFWINPFFYLVKKEIKTIHEFLADEFATNEKDKWNYAELLLMQVLSTQTHRLINPFFHNQIKRRIAMITLSKKPSYQYLRKIMVLPVAAIVIALFAFTYRNKQESNRVQKSFSDSLPKPHSKWQALIDARDNIILEADTLVSYPSASKCKIDFTKALVIINGQKKHPEILKTKVIISHSITCFSGDDPKTIQQFGKEAKNGVMIFEDASIYDISPLEFYKNDFTKQKNAKPDFVITADTIYRQSSKNETSIVFGNMTIKDKNGSANKLTTVTLNHSNKDTSNPFFGALVVINGKERPDIKSSSDLKEINPNDISSINVLKDSSAIIKYGDKAKNGAIEIFTKNHPTKKVITVVDSTTNGERRTTKIIEPKRNASSTTNPKSNIVFEKVEIAPSFSGGDTAWRNFLIKNLNTAIPSEKGAPDGKYTVWLQFIVDGKGNLSDLKALTKNGFGMEEECLRVMKLSPQWIPAKQNGHVVRAYTKQPITFVIESEEDSSTINANIHKLISLNETKKLSTIYPNPATNSITIPFTSALEGEGEVRIYDVNSKLQLVSRASLMKGLNNLKVKVDNFASGTYFITVTNANKKPGQFYKLIKQ
jgi:hypothetical protein